MNCAHEDMYGLQSAEQCAFTVCFLASALKKENYQ